VIDPNIADAVLTAGTTSTVAVGTTAEDVHNKEQNSKGNGNGNENKKGGDEDDDGKIIDKAHDEDEWTDKIDAADLSIRLDPVIKWKGLASNRDLETRNYVLEYLSVDRVKCTFELGKLDHIHHTRLEQVRIY
jgi:hypothetical protein